MDFSDKNCFFTVHEPLPHAKGGALFISQSLFFDSNGFSNSQQKLNFTATCEMLRELGIINLPIIIIGKTPSVELNSYRKSNLKLISDFGRHGIPINASIFFSKDSSVVDLHSWEFPEPGMLFFSKAYFGISLEKSYLMTSEMSASEAALRSGMGKTFMVEHPHSHQQELNSYTAWLLDNSKRIEDVCADMRSTLAAER